MSKPKKEVPKTYSVTLNIAGKDHTFKADNVADALINFQPLKLGGKAILTIKKDGKEFSRPIYPYNLKRLYVNKTFRAIFQKQMELMLK